jgi:hypothetical protein
MQGVFVRRNPMTERDDYLHVTHSTADMFQRAWATYSEAPVAKGIVAKGIEPKGKGVKRVAEGGEATTTKKSRTNVA